MTKAIFCSGCHDIVSPHPEQKHVRWCACYQWGVYWESPLMGSLVVVSLHEEEHRDAAPVVKVLGIHNGFLQGEYEDETGLSDLGVPVTDTGEKIRSLMRKADGYVFKAWECPIVRVDPEGPDGRIEVKHQDDVMVEKGGDFVWPP